MKSVSVPLTIEALHRLDRDESLPGDTEELQLTDETYTHLSASGVFDTINSTLCKMIDEYEDDSIQGPVELGTSLAIFNDALSSTGFDTIKRLVELNRLAIQTNTGMFFYF